MTRGPRMAAEAFLLKLAELSPTEQRAVLCGLPDTRSLTQRFENAWEQREAALGGVPFLTKDLYFRLGHPTNAGSTFLAEEIGVPRTNSSLPAAFQHDAAVPNSTSSPLGSRAKTHTSAIAHTRPTIPVSPAAPAPARPSPLRAAWCRLHSRPIPRAPSACPPRTVACGACGCHQTSPPSAISSRYLQATIRRAGWPVRPTICSRFRRLYSEKRRPPVRVSGPATWV